MESKTVETSLKKRGLAIIVTCDYVGTPSKLPGTNIDADEMETTFNELDYHVVLLKSKDATKKNIISTIQNISRDMHRFKGEKDKVVVFVFSGHGSTGDQIVSQEGARLCLDKMIVEPLLAKRETCEPPVLFFIDACRGSDHLYLKSGSGQPKSVDNLVKGLIQRKANFRLDYSTIEDHVSYMDDTGKESRWLPVVARQLRTEKNKSLQTIMADVKKEIWGGFSERQQPQTVDQLNCGSLHLHPRQGMRLSTVLFVYFSIGCAILGFVIMYSN